VESPGGYPAAGKAAPYPTPSGGCFPAAKQPACMAFWQIWALRTVGWRPASKHQLQLCGSPRYTEKGLQPQSFSL